MTAGHDGWSQQPLDPADRYWENLLWVWNPEQAHRYFRSELKGAWDVLEREGFAIVPVDGHPAFLMILSDPVEGEQT